MPDEHFHRISNVIPPADHLGADQGPESFASRMLTNPPMDASIAWTPEWRRAESPAANGHGNARSVARVQSVLSHGGTIDGREFLSPAGCDVVFDVQAEGIDLVLGVPLTLGVGYGLNSANTPIGMNPRTCFWGGWGGSIVVNDLDRRITVAYVMNRMGDGTLGDMRGINIVLNAWGALA